jgi:hypothetical protein
MSTLSSFLDGSELVLVAQVPKAGGRWHQVHMNAEVMRRFFRLQRDAVVEASFERVGRDGRLHGVAKRALVFSEANKNPKIEFDLRDAPDYPDIPPILLVLEIELRRFRYMLVMPSDSGYDEMTRLNAAHDSVGRGLRRVISTLAEVELRWPGCPLRSPKASQASSG